MKWYTLIVCVVSCGAVSSGTALTRDDVLPCPHVPRHGTNLIVNPSVNTAKGWSILRSATLDEATSRTADGSGSFKLTVPIPDKNSSMVFSSLIPVRPGQRLTCGFYCLTKNGPTYVGAQISLHDSDKKYLRNLIEARGGTSEDGEWQEFALPFVVPDNVAFIGVQAYKTDNTRPNGQVWVDDFYLGEGLGLEQPPSPKKSFTGAHVRVDSLGNFEVKRKKGWTPYFPLCMYSDNYRDWSVYSKQGWNTIIWTGAAHQVKQAKEAISPFNPEGMMAGFSIAQYTFPSGFAYNNLNDLKTKLREIFEQGLDDNLLLYYWDNENNHNQWQVPVNVINTIKRLDVDSSGNRLHPIYALQGTFNIARVHASKGLVDVSGTYFGGTAADTGGAGQGGEADYFMLAHLEKQTSPASFAQFNGVNGAGEMRMRLYNAIILGAKAMGYWRDSFHASTDQSYPDVGPVDKKAWWPDVPNLRREIDILLPLIRTPHWTSWTARSDQPDKVRIGTRNHQGACYLILVNQTPVPQTVVIQLDKLPYVATEVWGVFDEKKVATISGDSFSITLPPIGINSGTRVLRIVSGCDSTFLNPHPN